MCSSLVSKLPVTGAAMRSSLVRYTSDEQFSALVTGNIFPMLTINPN